MPPIRYECSDGTVVHEHFFDVFRWAVHDGEEAAFKFHNLLFPTLVDKGIGSCNKRNLRNRQIVSEELFAFLQKTEHNESIYSQILREGKVKKEVLFRDLKGLIVGGFDSIARSSATTIYHLKQNPHYDEKMQQYLAHELSYTGERNLLATLKETLTSERYNSMDFLTNVVKESFRLMPAGVTSLGY